jgi:phosphoserine aminotransferase
MRNSFYPGPSQLYPKVKDYLLEAYDSGVLSMNHRSDVFMDLTREVVRLLKLKLKIPENFTVFFTSSATECWEIIAQSLLDKESLHIYNGAFGEKWFRNTQKLNKEKHYVHDIPFSVYSTLKLDLFDLSTKLACFTQNETSNGTQIHPAFFKQFKEKFPNTLVAVDATSSMAGIDIGFENIDVAFASVQKCFGLPAGLALMVCSPMAINQALELNEINHYNSMAFMVDMMKNYQTTYTPNVLGIYLLHQVLKDIPTIDQTEKIIKNRANTFYSFFQNLISIHPLSQNQDTFSDTVICLEAEPVIIQKLKSLTQSENIILGNGYGQWKENTLRIANFPAIDQQASDLLLDVFRKNIQ